jgi:Malate/L-lactate dehydrogenase
VAFHLLLISYQVLRTINAMAVCLRSTINRLSLSRALPALLCGPSTRSASQDASDAVLVAIPEVTAFIERCMTAVGTKPTHAKALADNLMTADYRGHFSHGLNRLGRPIWCFFMVLFLVRCCTLAQEFLNPYNTLCNWADGESMCDVSVDNYTILGMAIMSTKRF